MSMLPSYTRIERQHKFCEHFTSQRWLKIPESLRCWSCWRARLIVLSVVLALIGGILLSITLFGEVEVYRQQAGIAGVTLLMFADAESDANSFAEVFRFRC